MSPELNIVIEKASDEMPDPEYGSEDAMAFDLRAWFPDPDGKEPDGIVLQPGERYPFSTGIKIEVPIGYGLFMNVRSGLGAKHGIQLVNNQGWIDPDYRGYVIACLLNTGNIAKVIKHGERIVQCVIMPIPRCGFTAGKVSATKRGEGGFGSTGA
jgi:dUTP pyrophosphatase